MAISAVSDWIRPSKLTDEVGGFVTTRSGAKDALEAILNAFEWMAHLDINKAFADGARRDLEPVKQGLSVPGFFSSLNDVRREVDHFFNSDDPDSTRRVFNSTMACVNQASESAMFLDSSTIYRIGSGMKAASTAFWGSALALDGVNFFYQIGRAESLNKEISKASDLDHKNILTHKVQHAYLSVLQCVTTIAMAAICLTSILYASIAHGFIFNPVVMLGLCSAWLILQFVNYFYDKMIGHWDNERKII